MAGLSVLSGRLVQIQLVNRQLYKEGERFAPRTEKLSAARGTIVDCHEEPLAKSIPVASVFVDKNHLTDPKLASYGLAFQEASAEPGWAELEPAKKTRRINEIRGELLTKEDPEVIVQKHLAYAIGIISRPLGMHREELREKIESSKLQYFPIAKDLPEDVADSLRDEIENHWIQGFEFENSMKRWYSEPLRASHVIGFTGETAGRDEDGKPSIQVLGKCGIEASMEAFLAGRDGTREHNRDARGLAAPGNSGSLKPPRAGLNVKLTIDMGIQTIVEEELDKGLAEFDSKKGAVILMNPKTGEILALASRPNFDLNSKMGLEKDDAGVNYAIQSIYEPGSTIKIVAASGALNEGLVTPQTSVFCFNGFYQGKGFIVKDAHPAGSLTVEGVLQKSNNNGAYNLGRQLTARRFYDYLHNYGFGHKTGILLNNELSGIARNTGREVDFSRACFGYATSVTPLQLACAYSAIASDGKLRKPIIVKSLIANDGTVVEDYAPEVVREVIKPRTAAMMRTALEKVVKDGTAKRAAVSGFPVGGKTGSVAKHKKVGSGYIGPDRNIVSFVGMMPAQDPAFVCLVVIDDPLIVGTKHEGGAIAAPVFRQIATRVATHMNLQPTEPLTTPLATAAR